MAHSKKQQSSLNSPPSGSKKKTSPARRRPSPPKGPARAGKRPSETRETAQNEHNASAFIPQPHKQKLSVPAQIQTALVEYSTSENTAACENRLPEILSPAGNTACALAALAAGADAVYLGLKHFSARMAAENFSITDLARLRSVAHAHNRKIFVAMNTLLKPNDPAHALRLIRRLVVDVSPDALIVQDLGVLPLVREAGFQGEVHLSTLANLTHQAALRAAAGLGVQRVILPRELSFDEIRLLNAACPKTLDLELFVHGALCYCVSGRCWWSSYMGGKSGLRGRCVQPCRRVYTQNKRQGRFFSCLDLSLDSLVRHLMPLSNIHSWKIEGRRKTPHYVYHVTTAYKLLRDEGGSPEARREADRLLRFALGRQNTKALFTASKGASQTEASGKLPVTDHPQPVTGGKEAQTGSGLLCGRIGQGEPASFVAGFPLLPNDYLRIGYEDEPWHTMVSVSRPVAEGESFSLPSSRNRPKPGTHVFLVDRKDPEIFAALRSWQQEFSAGQPDMPSRREDIMSLMPPIFARNKAKDSRKRQDILVRSSVPQGRETKSTVRPGTVQGLWLSPKALRGMSRTLYSRISWWLPPVIWPDEERVWQRMINEAVRNGAASFVCNAPWQAALFPQHASLALSAGPFCNTANAPALAVLASMGFSSAFISPELDREELLSLPGQSPLPLGVVVQGYWPMGLSRHNAMLKVQETFQSPQGEEFWIRRYGQNLWIYPAWPLDLEIHVPALQKAGYTLFARLEEYPPQTSRQTPRAGLFNWEQGLL